MKTFYGLNRFGVIVVSASIISLMIYTCTIILCTSFRWTELYGHQMESDHNVLQGSRKVALREHELAEMNCSILPDILLIGMEKCGTTTLRTFLGVHPKIFVPQPLQPVRFFDRINENLTLLEYFQLTQGQDNPEQCTPNGMLRIEKGNKSCPAKRTYDYIPNAKLLAIVKEPSERTVSQYLMFLYTKRIPRTVSFEEAINGRYRNMIIRWSLYADRMQRYADFYGAENIHIIDGDSFAANPVSELKKVETFVGIESLISQEDFSYNEEKHFYCARAESIGCMRKVFGVPHPVMRNETRRKLKAFLRPHNERFYKMVGRRFPWDD